MTMHPNRTWLALALLSGGAFALLALAQIHAPGYARVLDLPVSSLVAPFQTYRVVQAFLAVTALGDVAGIVAIALGSLVFLRAHPRYLMGLAAALLGSTLVANGVKVLVSRARPDALLWLDPFLSFSFPSGHATASMTLFGFLAIAGARIMRPGAKRTATLAFLALAVLLVGVSRLFLGAHFLSDVIGGWLLGFAWIALALSFIRTTHP